MWSHPAGTDVREAKVIMFAFHPGNALHSSPITWAKRFAAPIPTAQ
jgi:hypothetical protein